MFHCSYIGRNRPLLLITSCPCERLRGQGIGRINGRVTRAPMCFWESPSTASRTTTPLDTCSLGQRSRIVPARAKSPVSESIYRALARFVSAKLATFLFTVLRRGIGIGERRRRAVASVRKETRYSEEYDRC